MPLGEMDVVDTRLTELVTRRDEVLEEDGPKSRKLPKLAKAIAKVEGQQADLHEEVLEASKLELKKNKT